MPLFMIEREMAERIGLEELAAASLDRELSDESLHWLYSFLSADQRTSFCLFEAPSAEYIRALTERAGLPPAAVIEVEKVDRSTFEQSAAAG
jgi:hypothetical protein